LTHALELASKDSAASESASLYENLRFFLRSGFMIPPTSSMDERAVYRDLNRRLADVGDIPMTEATRILGYLVD